MIEAYRLGTRGRELESTGGHPFPLRPGEWDLRVSTNHHDGQPETTPAWPAGIQREAHLSSQAHPRDPFGHPPETKAVQNVVTAACGREPDEPGVQRVPTGREVVHRRHRVQIWCRE